MRTDRLMFVAFLLCIACGGHSRPAARDSDAETRLETLLACHDARVGGDRLRQANAVEYDLEILEPGFSVEGRYRAERSGTARIDIFANGERVFSEGWDGSAGWQLPQGATEPVPTSDEGAAALRHGIEHPSHLWTLADMTRNGHTLEWADSVPGEPGDDHVLKLTLADGSQSWYWVDLATCLVTASRDFRAFHPDADPEARWVESRYADYRETDGITKAWLTVNIDLVTGDTLGRTRLTDFRVR